MAATLVGLWWRSGPAVAGAALAAYANRSLMFEQRISGSYYRASMAQEMAEGGIDWTVAMLNGSGIDASCQPSTGGARRLFLFEPDELHQQDDRDHHARAEPEFLLAEHRRGVDDGLDPVVVDHVRQQHQQRLRIGPHLTQRPPQLPEAALVERSRHGGSGRRPVGDASVRHERPGRPPHGG